MTVTPDRSSLPGFSREGLYLGARLTLPLLPGCAVFAAGYGTIAGQKGLTLFEALLMSGLVFAGASQFVALEAWSPVFTLGGLFAVALITATVNMRYVLMAASMRPWLGPLPAWQAYGSILWVVDANWIVSMRYRGEGGSDIGVYLGSTLVLWIVFVGGTVPGYLLGALVSDPKRFGLDLMLPIFFVAMLVPMWRGPRRAIPWLVAGAVALAVSLVVPGYWFIIVGAIAGSIAGGFLDE